MLRKRKLQKYIDLVFNQLTLKSITRDAMLKKSLVKVRKDTNLTYTNDCFNN